MMSHKKRGKTFKVITIKNSKYVLTFFKKGYFEMTSNSIIKQINNKKIFLKMLQLFK